MSFKNWFLILPLFLASIVTSNAQSTDIEAIKAVNEAFYAALSARDLKAMEAVWSKNPSIILIAPGSKTINVGWDAVKNYWVTVFDLFPKISITSEFSQGQTDGKMAWLVGTETAQVQSKRGGEPVKMQSFVTHIFEKVGDRWLLVSHQSQPVPK